MAEIRTKTKYKEQIYGYDPGRLIIETARILGSAHKALPKMLYTEKIEHARCMMQALISAIPDNALGINYDDLLVKIESMRVIK